MREQSSAREKVLKRNRMHAKKIGLSQKWRRFEKIKYNSKLIELKRNSFVCVLSIRCRLVRTLELNYCDYAVTCTLRTHCYAIPFIQSYSSESNVGFCVAVPFHCDPITSVHLSFCVHSFLINSTFRRKWSRLTIFWCVLCRYKNIHR